MTYKGFGIIIIQMTTELETSYKGEKSEHVKLTAEQLAEAIKHGIIKLTDRGWNEPQVAELMTKRNEALNGLRWLTNVLRGESRDRPELSVPDLLDEMDRDIKGALEFRLGSGKEESVDHLWRRKAGLMYAKSFYWLNDGKEADDQLMEKALRPL